MPQMSTRPGNFDTTGPLFNPEGRQLRARSGQDPEPARRALFSRRMAMMAAWPRWRDFVRNVIVNEFSGPEPSPVILDAIVGPMSTTSIFCPIRRSVPAGD